MTLWVMKSLCIFFSRPKTAVTWPSLGCRSDGNAKAAKSGRATILNLLVVWMTTDGFEHDLLCLVRLGREQTANGGWSSGQTFI